MYKLTLCLLIFISRNIYFNSYEENILKQENNIKEFYSESENIVTNNENNKFNSSNNILVTESKKNNNETKENNIEDINEENKENNKEDINEEIIEEESREENVVSNNNSKIKRNIEKSDLTIINENAVDKLNEVVLIDKSNGSSCAQAIEYFYEDTYYRYYFLCIKSHNMYVIKNGREYKLVDALNQNIVTMQELEQNGYSFPKTSKNTVSK